MAQPWSSCRSSSTRPTGTAAAFLDELEPVMHEKNVFRGQTVSFSWGRHGEFGLDFVRVPRLERSDVILPEESLAAIEQHTLTMTNHSAALLEAGRRLRRGLLLFGPPGHRQDPHGLVPVQPARRANRAAPGRAGPQRCGIRQAGALAREARAVDGGDRGRRPGSGWTAGCRGPRTTRCCSSSSTRMDGIAEDTDVIFVLTTNRVDLLEARLLRHDPAGSTAPWRSACRTRPPASGSCGSTSELRRPIEPCSTRSSSARAARAAALIKELARLSILTSTAEGITVDEALPRALDGIIEHATPVLRRILGLIDPDDERVADGPAATNLHRPGGARGPRCDL